MSESELEKTLTIEIHTDNGHLRGGLTNKKRLDVLARDLVEIVYGSVRTQTDLFEEIRDGRFVLLRHELEQGTRVKMTPVDEVEREKKNLDVAVVIEAEQLMDNNGELVDGIEIITNFTEDPLELPIRIVGDYAFKDVEPED